ncbi:MAG TPA: hypothetical protein VM073_06955, partial [Usitatibacter sp.]|nr:hypothetical protein [Usitatibacter sp.]
AVTVLMRSLSIDAIALMGMVPIEGMRPDVRYVLTHLPFALVVAILFAHARIPARLPPNPAFYGAVGILALAKLAIFYVSFPLMWAVVLALLVGVVVILLRLAPRTGDRYQAELMPGVPLFLGASLLLALAWPRDQGWMLMHAMQIPAVKQLPHLVPNFVVAAVVVGIFVVASGIRHRAMQLNPGPRWLWAGIVIALVVEVAGYFLRGVFKAELILAVRAAAHLMLFVGAFYVLSHLLPRREADELH